MLKNFHSSPISKFGGSISVPGDKSISHRSIMLSAIAEGTVEVDNFLLGADCMATMNAFKAMGVNIEQSASGRIRVHGVGLHGLQAPKKMLDLGNSGTSIRLLAGLLAGQKFPSILTGDSSLQNRPMGRVVHPLLSMGANIAMAAGDKAPLQIYPCKQLRGIEYEMPIASAQVKSALLLAGIYAAGDTTICEPAPTRDHTERMLAGFGVTIDAKQGKISMRGGQKLTVKSPSILVPGDISSAAFFIVAASILPNAHLIINNVGINPTRTGVLEILKLMGADIKVKNTRQICGEPVADLEISAAPLTGITIPQHLIPLAIDEFPVIFIAAACAKGETVLQGAAELRVKESDRLHTMAEGLMTLGIQCQETVDGIIIQPGKFTAGVVKSYGDHRIAMAFSVAGLVALGSIEVIDCENVNTSFPNFVTLLNQLGADIRMYTS